MATDVNRPKTGTDRGKSETRKPAPAPVDTSEESVAGEEDPGASNEELEEPAFNRPPLKRPSSDGVGR